MEYPSVDELVLATVKKILPYGAFCSLDEYPGVEAFIHISEVSPGWIRNIREHIKEGQKVVGKIMLVQPETGQIDLSLKRISEADRKRKQESFKLEKRAQRLLEVAAKKLGKNVEDAKREVIPFLLKEYDGIYPALEALSEDKLETSLPKKWLDALSEVVKEEIKPKRVELRANLQLMSHASDGIERIKQLLKKIAELQGVSIHYVGAPKYYMDVVAGDYKTAEKTLKKIEGVLEEASRKEKIEYSLEKAK
ncbi:translation initiation factor IF-2 subunit alpha [Candidatus Micrarchaeota archaeon]|nr:translation initiation factor IF-2 subunit alpha [Candidatus Micrarchaeota archaeon]